MIIRVTSDGVVSLEQRENFRGFHLASELPQAREADLARAVEAAGLRIEDGHVWVPRAWLIGKGDDLGPEWREGLDGMMAYAGQKGWVDRQSDAVRIHIDWLK